MSTKPESSAIPPHIDVPTPFQPTVSWLDGDLILRSADGVEFRVHSLLLRLSSKVFADMMSTPLAAGKEKETGDAQTIGLEEEAETVDTLLRWIYPVEKRPRIASLDDFKKYMPIVMKYDIRTALDSHYAAMESLDVISSNPCQAYAISVLYDIPGGVRAAARQIVIKDIHVFDRAPVDEFGDISWKAVKRLDNLRLECIRSAVSIINAEIVPPDHVAHKSRHIVSHLQAFRQQAAAKPLSEVIYTREFSQTCWPDLDQTQLDSALKMVRPQLQRVREKIKAKLDSYIECGSRASKTFRRRTLTCLHHSILMESLNNFSFSYLRYIQRKNFYGCTHTQENTSALRGPSEPTRPILSTC